MRTKNVWLEVIPLVVDPNEPVELSPLDCSLRDDEALLIPSASGWKLGYVNRLGTEVVHDFAVSPEREDEARQHARLYLARRGLIVVDDDDE